MTLKDRKRIALEISASLERSLLETVTHRAWPEDWDGHHIAAYARRIGANFGGSEDSQKRVEREIKRSQAFYELP